MLKYFYHVQVLSNIISFAWIQMIAQNEQQWQVRCYFLISSPGAGVTTEGPIGSLFRSSRTVRRSLTQNTCVQGSASPEELFNQTWDKTQPSNVLFTLSFFLLLSSRFYSLINIKTRNGCLLKFKLFSMIFWEEQEH